MSDKTILLIEDNPDDEKLTVRAIGKSEFQSNVIVARDGVEALDYLFSTGPYASATPPPRPMLVLLDLKLPKLDGLEVLRRIRADDRTKRLPVVVLTTSKEEQDLLTSYNIGVNSYIRKPVDFNTFTEVVRQLGLYWLTLNEIPAM